MAAKGGTGAVDPRDEDREPGRDTEQPDPRRIASQPDFGRELTLARQRAGLTVREVARAVGIPASTTGDYFAGRQYRAPERTGAPALAGPYVDFICTHEYMIAPVHSSP